MCSFSFLFLTFWSLRYILVFTLHYTNIDIVLVSTLNSVCLRVLLSFKVFGINSCQYSGPCFVTFGDLCEWIYLQNVWYIIWLCLSLSESMWISFFLLCLPFYSAVHSWVGAVYGMPIVLLFHFVHFFLFVLFVQWLANFVVIAQFYTTYSSTVSTSIFTYFAWQLTICCLKFAANRLQWSCTSFL